MIGDMRYAPVESALPEMLPVIKRVDALKMYVRLVNRFGRDLDAIPVGVLEARGGRPIESRRTTGRKCWASSKPTRSADHDHGWGRMIHDASHYVFRLRHPNARPHDGGHAKLEREMAEYAATRLIPAFIEHQTVKKVRPTLSEKVAHTQDLIIRWERKAKRADTALKKLRRRLKALERKEIG
jgi:hypothetical protein